MSVSSCSSSDNADVLSWKRPVRCIAADKHELTVAEPSTVTSGIDVRGCEPESAPTGGPRPLRIGTSKPKISTKQERVPRRMPHSDTALFNSLLEAEHIDAHPALQYNRMIKRPLAGSALTAPLPEATTVRDVRIHNPGRKLHGSM